MLRAGASTITTTRGLVRETAVSRGAHHSLAGAESSDRLIGCCACLDPRPGRRDGDERLRRPVRQDDVSLDGIRHRHSFRGRWKAEAAPDGYRIGST